MGDELRPVVVTGFGRSGTTMAMHMLRAGGIPWVPGTHDESGEQDLPVRFVAGHASKHLVTGPQHARSIPWWGQASVIWCTRNHREQARSMRKFLAGADVDFPLTDSAAARQPGLDERDIWGWLRRSGVTPIVVDFDGALRDPWQAAHRLAEDLAEMVRLDAPAMAAVIHRRSPRCAPDLSYEVTKHDPRHTTKDTP